MAAVLPVQVGDWVMFVLDIGKSVGQSRPAFVMRAFGDTVDLRVLTDGTKDFALGEVASEGYLYATSVPYSKGSLNNLGQSEYTPRTWHLPGE